jgi:asparagine synthase (glutamine-hydrolysing)
MCGISGVVDLSGAPAAKMAAEAEAMAATMIHRGPDGGGCWSADCVGLSHRRLSIIDLEGGTQPMVGSSGRVIVFNGEIYNFVELKAELEAAGLRFATHSDTEVLLRAFERWGVDCLGRLVGMYSFAIWDPADRSLFLARDRLGKKPLFLARDGKRLAFASEIKALLTLDWVRDGAATDYRAISDFLSLGYILGPKTAFANMEQLLPGHWARWDESGWRSGEYWSLADLVKAPKVALTSAVGDRFMALLEDAVRIRLRSDVPVGVHLSGGIDSSAVMAVAARVAATPPKAFVAAFDEGEFDESGYARLVAAHVGAAIESCHGHGAGEGLGRMLWHYDQPFADTSLVPTFHLNAMARPFARVVLGGDGADELFAGYPTYVADRAYGVYRHMPRPLQRGLSSLADRLVRPRYGKVGWDYKLRQFLKSGGLSREEAHYWWRCVFSEAEKRRLLSPDALAAMGDYRPFDAFAEHFRNVEGGEGGFLDRSLYVDIKTWLADDILVKVDRASMASSVEVRSPLLDHRLVEFAFTLPESAKMAGGRQKVILKDAMATLLPPEIMNRKKRGFNAPTRPYWRPDSDIGGKDDGILAGLALDETREDVTFRRFGLSVLSTWLEMVERLRAGGGWPRPS